MIEKQRLQHTTHKQERPSNKDTDRYRSSTTQNRNVKEWRKEGRLIRKQRVMTQKTVENQPSQKLDDLCIYGPQTPQHIKTEKQEVLKRIKNQDVNSFKMEDSLDNRHVTVKRQYTAETYDLKKDDITLNKQKVDLRGQQGQKKASIKKSRSEYDQKKEGRQSGNGLLRLDKGWYYKGEYIEGLFHGYGQLYHKGILIYSGQFQFGYFHGYGKLQHHPSFSYLIKMGSIQQQLKNASNIDDIDSTWSAYFGEFLKGNITGYGEIWLDCGEKVAARWQKGSIRGRKCVLKGTNES